MSGTTVNISFIAYPGSVSSGGGGGSPQSTNGSITNPGQSGNVAQAVQGIAGGVAMPVSQAANAPSNSANGVMGVAVGIVVPFSASRKWVMITNRSTNSETQDVGAADVTVGGGIPLNPGGGFLFNGNGAQGPIYGITTVANSPFSYVEG